MNKRDSDYYQKKILLMLLPFWDPLVPPQGISHLKSYLQHHGYIVKTKDANTHVEFKELYKKYFDIFKRYVPGNRQGNFFNIGHDVMRNHMMAHIHYKDEAEYIKLVKIIIYKTFFTGFSDEQVYQLKEVLDEFYRRLEKYILDLLEEEKPGVLGISVLRDTIAPSLFAFKRARERYPHIKTVMGGSIFSDHLLVGTPNFEFFLEKTPYIDNIIIGEGQNLFLKLLEGELPGSQKVFTLKDIGGETLGYSSLNIPDLSDFNIAEDYPYLAAQGSSSCPNQCSFCNVVPFFGKYREKSPEQTVSEMKNLYEKYGVQLFFMNDALLNGVATLITNEFIKADLSLYWDGYLRVGPSVCEFDNTMLWRRGGLYRVRLGVESGSQHVLDLIDKGITPAETQTALANLANAGIKTTTYWVIGHPGETGEDFLQTLELLEECKDDIYEAECNPFIYGYLGQGKSDLWKEKRALLYPEEAKDMLILQSWIVDGEPSREETYRRINRFTEHCKRLGIPNPYSLHEIYKADLRWEKLHRNAVPRLVDLADRTNYIDENKNVQKLVVLQNTLQDDGDFGF